MKTHANQMLKQRVRITGIPMVMSRAAVIAILVAWTPSSIGSANHDSAPNAGLRAVRAAGTKAVPADPGHRPGDFPAGPMCAKLAVTAQRVIEGSGVSADTVGCGMGNNMAAATPARVDEEDRVDVATFLAWHVEGRNLAQNNNQTTPSAWSRTNAQDHRASVFPVRTPFWTTIVR
ncbi:MAG TPA: hypothetical protein VJT81_06370 [Burkholderiales bacterium]|nr:hypothetical protein [Burkholderiales bacterium]